MNKDLRQEIKKVLDSVFCLADGSEYDEYLNGDNDADAILSLVYSHLEKKIDKYIEECYTQNPSITPDEIKIMQILKEELIGK